MFNHASEQLLRQHTWNPRCAQNFRGLMFSKKSGRLLREHTRNPQRLDLHPHTRHREMFMRQDCCMCSHATSTLGSLSLRKQACSGAKTAAFSRHERTWTSPRAQKDMFRRKECCALAPRAHLDPSPCAN